MIYKTDVEYILKPAKAKKSVKQMAKEANGSSRSCANADKYLQQKINVAQDENIAYTRRKEHNL